jgi:hypothetical protein
VSTIWAEADIETLKKHYSTGETAMLAALLRRRPGAVISKANKLGLKKEAEAPHTIALIRELAKRPDGFRTAQLPGDGHTNSGVVWKQVQAGYLFKLSISHKNVRYFDSIKSAEAYKNKNCKPASVTVKHHGPARAPWKPDTPAYYPPGFKITVIPCKQDGFHTSTHSED